MSKTIEYRSGGIGLGSLLGVLFVGLKLTGHIDWSWWLVLLPFYVVPLIIVAFIVVTGLIVLVAATISEIIERAGRK